VWGIVFVVSSLPEVAFLEVLHGLWFWLGWYTGQETVARVHFRGHVNRHLRGLRTASPEPPAPRAALFDATGKEVGDVRSVAASPRLGGVAIGMVRREVEIGATLMARWDGGESRVDVAHLPFPG
jgi:folate-binding Fe-S cluster repair protein YgfZ